MPNHWVVMLLGVSNVEGSWKIMSLCIRRVISIDSSQDTINLNYGWPYKVCSFRLFTQPIIIGYNPQKLELRTVYER